MSALITRRTWRTPASPRAATAHAQARPTNTARAERDHLHNIEAGAHAPVRQHLGLVSDRLDDGGQRADGRRHRVELAAAVVGDDDAVDARCHRAPGVLRVEHALDDQSPAPVLSHSGDVVPRHARVELSVHPVTKGRRRARSRHGPLEVAER
jgi:hypothetical protein